jgi:hypothetical protein
VFDRRNMGTDRVPLTPSVLRQLGYNFGTYLIALGSVGFEQNCSEDSLE